jgi:protein-S-isoprenylcysteine O-methyltransferase Ste14
VDPLRIYFFAGLIAHKAYWEYMKRGTVCVPKTNASACVSLIKAIKVAILIFICLQTLVMRDIFPISEAPATLRMMGGALFTLGLATAIIGRSQLGKSWADIETPTSVAKPALVSRGLYQYIRHPIYTGDILLLIGLELGLNSWFVLLIILLIPVILLQAIREERLLVIKLPGYGDYCRRTKRFLPFVA